jgi:HK97 family phage prohead protease
MSNSKETRILHVADQGRQTRALKDTKGNMIITGYASVFNQRSRLIFENGEIFYEIIERGAFDKALNSPDLDVILTYQHNANEPLARLNKARGIKSLELSTDSYGLKYRATLNNSQAAKDTYERVKSGDLFENSFVFTVDATGERWTRGEDGTPLRYVSKVNGLYDVSVVVNGAYANTDVAAAERSFKQHGATPSQEYFDKLHLEILQLGSR